MSDVTRVGSHEKTLLSSPDKPTLTCQEARPLSLTATRNATDRPICWSKDSGPGIRKHRVMQALALTKRQLPGGRREYKRVYHELILRKKRRTLKSK